MARMPRKRAGANPNAKEPRLPVGMGVLYRGQPEVTPAGGPRLPEVSQYVTATWSWVDQSNGIISWTFANSDTNNSHLVVLYRNSYIFGGAFWPIYLAGSNPTSSMLDGTQPIPAASGSGAAPMGILDYGVGASPRFQVAFIFNLGPGQMWSMQEAGFAGPPSGPISCYELVDNAAGNYCVGYDPQRVVEYNATLGLSGQYAIPGYSPNPKTFDTYAFTPEPNTPQSNLYFTDHIGIGTCTSQNFYFVIKKNDFGIDEVKDQPIWPSSFYLFLEGFSPNGLNAQPNLGGAFDQTNIPGLSVAWSGTSYDIGATGSDGDRVQRIRFAYDISFNNFREDSLSVFPAPGSPPKAYELDASIQIWEQALPFTSKADFYLLGGADPYFTNLRGNNGYFYLSQDLRVFTATAKPGMAVTPVEGPGALTLTDSVQGAYGYIQSLIDYLNQQFGYRNLNYTPPDTNLFDPLDSFLPHQDGALYGDSTVTPKSGSLNNYNFAIARVRLRGSSTSQNPEVANNIKVFFRLFTTQTSDTDYVNKAGVLPAADPNLTYPSDNPDNPTKPLPGTDRSGNINGCTLPFFVNNNYLLNPNDYTLKGVNNQTITIPPNHDYAWAFFGCFLNVYDGTNIYGYKSAQGWLAGSAHCCLVAQIADADAPIVNANGVLESPENSDKLAQRNLQVTYSGNPGFPATHLVAQTVDVRPSQPPPTNDRSSLLSYPDELMIDWGKVPIGSVVRLHWPAVSSASVLQLAAGFYAEQMLTAMDANTIQCQVVSQVTYIPIPVGTGGSFGGLFTVELPSSIQVGNEFEILVQRITTKQIPQAPPPPAPPPGPQVRSARIAAPQAGAPKTLVPAAVVPAAMLWRYVTGSFLMRIAVQKEAVILPADENLLSILQWRLTLIGAADRWYPVLLRWIGCLSQRILGMGGDPSQIPPSPNGYQPPAHPRPSKEEHCYTGKVISMFFDRFGDFHGFDLRTEKGEEHSFRAVEHEIEQLIYRAWVERFVITVCVHGGTHHVESVVLRRAPRALRE